MLLHKQLKIKNNIANKLCSLVNDKCEKVTDSNGGKIWGLATLSEVGFAFFFVNVVILILYSKAITSVGLFSFIVLPFSFWSLWYQKFVAKSWCVLCLLCLILMWFQALIFFFSGLMSSIVIDVIPFVIVCLSYIGVSLVLNKLTGVFKDRYSAIHWHLRYNGLKYDDRILKAIQQGAQKFDVSSENCSSLVFGNANAKRNITIFSNPFCNPCSELHELIKDYPGDNVSVRYSMTAFSEELTVINRYNCGLPTVRSGYNMETIRRMV